MDDAARREVVRRAIAGESLTSLAAEYRVTRQARPPWWTVVVLLLGLAVVSAWYSAFVLTVWRYSPR